MEAKHLEPDELEYELKLRRLRHSSRLDISTTPLQEILEKEQQGILPKPAGIPSYSDVNNERRKCEEKALSLQELANIASATRNRYDLLVARSRLLHLLGRINLLIEGEPSVAESLTLVKTQVRKSLELIEGDLQTQPSNGSGSSGEELCVGVESEEVGLLSVVNQTSTQSYFTSLPTTLSVPTTTSLNTTASQYYNRPVVTAKNSDVIGRTSMGAIPKVLNASTGQERRIPSGALQEHQRGRKELFPMQDDWAQHTYRGTHGNRERPATTLALNTTNMEASGGDQMKSNVARLAPTDSHAEYSSNFSQDHGTADNVFPKPFTSVPTNRNRSMVQYVSPHLLQPQNNLPPQPHYQPLPPPQPPTSPSNPPQRRVYTNPVSSWQVRFDGSLRSLSG